MYSHAVHFVVKRKLGPLAGLAESYYRCMEKGLLLDSDGVICISEGFAEIAREWGVPEDRIAVIENWAPLNEVVPADKDNGWAREQGLHDRFCFLYSGTLGMKHRPELLLDLARRLEERGDAQLVVIAAGAGADWLREKASTVSAEALRMLPFQPYHRLSEVLAAGDVLIGLLNSEAGVFCVPSKIYSYLCARRPLLLAAPRENHASVVIERAQAGLVVSPDSSEGFVQAAVTLMEIESLRARCAAAGRAWAERNFDIQLIADRFIEQFDRPVQVAVEGGVLAAAQAGS